MSLREFLYVSLVCLRRRVTGIVTSSNFYRIIYEIVKGYTYFFFLRPQFVAGYQSIIVSVLSSVTGLYKKNNMWKDVTGKSQFIMLKKQGDQFWHIAFSVVNFHYSF